MAKVDVKTTWDGAGFELEDVDLEQITNRDLIQQMIDAGVMASEAELPVSNSDLKRKYSVLDKRRQPHPSDEVKTLVELGYCDGDEIRIVLPAWN